ncbi:hypothetical protein FND36_12050 [Lachnospiraceae bacterium KGMB03038]|nr:hypothetical protein FND36_12050 [Lachnospiraceae bacterium KGMB03038]
MEHTISSSLIETFVREKVVTLKENPERASRNMVDLALHFSKDGFQKNFLKIAQRMLQDENSGYYRLIRDVFTHVASEHLVTFGMNLGYHSFTKGAKQIRQEEADLGFHIPWSIALLADGKIWESDSPSYRSLFQQGQNLGIYTWLLLSQRNPEQLLPLIQETKDCAFFLFCSPESITDSFLESAVSINNLMVSVEYGAAAPHACGLLRDREMLYSLYVPYNEEDIPDLKKGDFLWDLSELYPAFAFLLPRQVSPKLSEELYQFILETRNQLECRTVPLEAHDWDRIDQIFSGNSLAVFFNQRGDLFSRDGFLYPDSMNFHQAPLRQILRNMSRA